MNKQRYGIRQKVTDGDLNQLQDYAETGMEAVAADIVVGGGVVKGMDVTAAGTFKVSIASGTARDANGARASLLEAVTMDLTANRPSAGQETWITLMAYRTRTQSDPRVNPAGATYYFQLAESTQITVEAGAPAAVGAAARPARPDNGGVLVADVLLKGDAAAIGAADISTTRREVYTPVSNLPASQITVTPGAAAGYAADVDQVQEALDDVGARVKTHVQAPDPHPQYALDSDLNNYVPKAEKGVASGVASLGSDGKVPATQLPATATGSYIPTSEKGANSGVASLDATGKVVQDAKTVGGKKPGAAAGDLPILNPAGKVPHSITGDAASVGGKTPGEADGNLALLDANGRVADAAKLGGAPANLFARVDQSPTFTKTVLFDGGGPIMALKPGTADHVYMQFYARSDAPNARSGYVGFPGAASADLTIANELVGGTIRFVTTGTVRMPKLSVIDNLPIIALEGEEAGGRPWHFKEANGRLEFWDLAASTQVPMFIMDATGPVAMLLVGGKQMRTGEIYIKQFHNPVTPFTTTTTTTPPIIGTNQSPFIYDAARWQGGAFYLEGFIKSSVSNVNAFVELYDQTASAVVAVASTSSTTPIWAINNLPQNLQDGHSYVIRAYMGATGTCTVYEARLTYR